MGTVVPILLCDSLLAFMPSDNIDVRSWELIEDVFVDGIEAGTTGKIIKGSAEDPPPTYLLMVLYSLQRQINLPYHIVLILYHWPNFCQVSRIQFHMAPDRPDRPAEQIGRMKSSWGDININPIKYLR